jgi:hypothetical protein
LENGIVEQIESLFRSAKAFYVDGGFTPWTFLPYYLGALFFLRLPTILNYLSGIYAARRQFRLDSIKLSAKILRERQKRERKNEKE